MTKKPDDIIFVELGRSGLTRFGGHIDEEWATELSGSKGAVVYKKMATGDPVVGAMLFAIRMLISNVSWWTEPGGDSEADRAAADFVQSCIHDMSYTWADTLSQILSLLPYGWAYMEKTFKIRGGIGRSDPRQRSKHSDRRIGWRKWEIRAQETLLEWSFGEEDGSLLGMHQMAPPDYQARFIPIEKALLFRLSSEKNNPEGQSILRTAWRPWYLKTNLEDIEAIGIERDLAGLPIVYVPTSVASPKMGDTNAIAALESYKKLVSNLRRDEEEGIVLPSAFDQNGNRLYDIKLLSSQGTQRIDTNRVIRRYESNMAMSVMADFLLLGSVRTGSFALSQSKTDLFTSAIEAILDSVADVINTHAIPELVSLNAFAGLIGMPRLFHGPISAPDLQTLGEFISRLAGAGAKLFPDDDLENHLREAANLPRKKEAKS